MGLHCFDMCSIAGGPILFLLTVRRLHNVMLTSNSWAYNIVIIGHDSFHYNVVKSRCMSTEFTRNSVVRNS